jgi:hypothetical protein
MEQPTTLQFEDNAPGTRKAGQGHQRMAQVFQTVSTHSGKALAFANEPA